VRFRGRWVAKGAAFLVLGLAFVAVLSFVVMSLWNALIPSLIHGPDLTFWQAAGVLILSRILFGGFRGRGGHGWHGHHGGWRQRMWREKWESMTPEERERLRARFKHRCGWESEEPPQEPPPNP
jgi:Ca2+/H+ antiporter, TMEM165/GDT1 family